jgi:acetyl-CoA acetyltransferase
MSITVGWNAAQLAEVSREEMDDWALGSHHKAVEAIDQGSMCVATVRMLEIDPARVNPNGSGCSLGHQIAMTGARMVTTLVHELGRRGGGIGVAAICAGGGMSSAMIIEV